MHLPYPNELASFRERGWGEVHVSDFIYILNTFTAP